MSASQFPATRDGILLTPGAAQGPEITTERHSHIGRKGDLAIELHYGDFQTGHGRQAALKVFRAGHDTEAIYVPLSMLWQFVEREALHVLIPPLAKRVYGFVTKQDQFRLLDAIIDYLDDLKNSPPDPQLFKDRSLDAFLESCAQEGLEFFVDVNGKRVVG